MFEGVSERSWSMFRPAESLDPAEFAITEGLAAEDNRLVDRIAAAYRLALSSGEASSTSFWDNEYNALKRPVHDDLLSGDRARLQRTLRDPARSNLFFGFDLPCAYDPWSGDRSLEIGTARSIHDLLVRLGEAVGVCRLEDPQFREGAMRPSLEELILRLDEAFGFRLDFPNPFPDEVGLRNSRGVATFRSLQALFQAWRIAQLRGSRPEYKVVEIGAGLGRTAYYAQRFGVSHYTIVDLPMSNVAQAYFLERVLGPETVSLLGENEPHAIRIRPPSWFLDVRESFDLVVNVDSMTEMDAATATAYVGKIAQHARVLLSINHEHRAFTVRELCRAISTDSIQRNPYWMRQGYVEELVIFPEMRGTLETATRAKRLLRRIRTILRG